MNSKTTEHFWKCYTELPATIKKRAREAYRLFAGDPHHPSLRFKRIHSARPIFCVRIARDYRAVGTLQENEIVWFWIGSHSDYNKLLKQLRSR